MDEADISGNARTSLYEAIVRRLRQLEIAWTPVQAGIMGFGRHQKVHHKRLFGISDDRPVIISVADSEAKLREVLPEIRTMVQEGLVLSVDAELVQLTMRAACPVK